MVVVSLGLPENWAITSCLQGDWSHITRRVSSQPTTPKLLRDTENRAVPVRQLLWTPACSSLKALDRSPAYQSLALLWTFPGDLVPPPEHIPDLYQLQVSIVKE